MSFRILCWSLPRRRDDAGMRRRLVQVSEIVTLRIADYLVAGQTRPRAFPCQT